MQIFSSLRTKDQGKPLNTCPGFLIAPNEGNSKVSHISYFIYLKTPPDTSDQKPRLAHIFFQDHYLLAVLP